ncbi:MAG: hypothetical protein KF799_15040 [Bdellovibrionales bacterium]|nr:hypothetical protein [Bdellovibrionales bacterium]
MANVVALVKDERVRRSIELYLNELDMDLRFAIFSSVEEFEQLYFQVKEEAPAAAESAPQADETAPASAPVPEPNPEDEGAELKLFSEVHLLIFALDTINEKSDAWINKMRANMRKFKRMPENGDAMRLVMLKYEDDNIGKLDVLHRHLDDLVYLPLDRLIFLQKMQIFLTLPKRVTPSFLFNQEVKQPIEISKIVKLDRFSDVALAIRNPVPLKKGLPGHFYMSLPGEKNRLEVFGKVLRSEPHPEHEGQFLVYFTYFGLGKTGLSVIRRALSKSAQYKSLLFDDRNKFRYKPDDLFVADADRHTFGTVIIDTDETAGTAMMQTLNKEMDRLNVVTESSYQVFLHRYLETGGSAKDTTPPRATDDTDFYANPISLTISAKDLKVLSVDPGPSDSATFLGHPAAIIFSSPDKWLSLVQEKESRLIMEEAAVLAGKGRVLDKLLAVQDAHNQRCAVNFKIYKGATEGTVTIDLTPASLNDILNKMQSETKSQSVEALILDSNFVPEEPASWIEGMRLRATQVELIDDPKKLKFWMISESERIEQGWINTPDILGMFIKPVDQRQLLFSLSENLPNKNTIYSFENLGWTTPNINIHISKDVELEALSEFGATLKSKQKIVAGSMLYLRRSIFENAPNGCLAARVYACEEHQSDKNYFQIYCTYFGINDAFLKFARTWIRENYAHQKAKE